MQFALKTMKLLGSYENKLLDNGNDDGNDKLGIKLPLMI